MILLEKLQICMLSLIIHSQAQMQRVKIAISKTFELDYAGEFTSPDLVTNALLQQVGTADASVFRFIEWFPCGSVQPATLAEQLRWKSGGFIVSDVASGTYLAFESSTNTQSILLPVLEGPGEYVDLLSIWQSPDVVDYVSDGLPGWPGSWLGKTNSQLSTVGKLVATKIGIETNVVQTNAASIVNGSIGTLLDGRTQAWQSEETFRFQSMENTYAQSSLRTPLFLLYETPQSESGGKLTSLSKENRSNFNPALYADIMLNQTSAKLAEDYVAKTNISATSEKNSLTQMLVPLVKTTLSGRLFHLMVGQSLPLPNAPCAFISPELACVGTNFNALVPPNQWATPQFQSIKCMPPPLCCTAKIEGTILRVPGTSLPTPQIPLQISLYATHVYAAYQRNATNNGNIRYVMQTEKSEFLSYTFSPQIQLCGTNTYNFSFRAAGMAGLKWLGTFLSFYALSTDASVMQETVTINDLKIVIPAGATQESYGPVNVARLTGAVGVSISVNGIVEEDILPTGKALQRLSLHSMSIGKLRMTRKRDEGEDDLREQSIARASKKSK